MFWTANWSSLFVSCLICNWMIWSPENDFHCNTDRWCSLCYHWLVVSYVYTLLFQMAQMLSGMVGAGAPGKIVSYLHHVCLHWRDQRKVIIDNLVIHDCCLSDTCSYYVTSIHCLHDLCAMRIQNCNIECMTFLSIYIFSIKICWPIYIIYNNNLCRKPHF